MLLLCYIYKRLSKYLSVLSLMMATGHLTLSPNLASAITRLYYKKDMIEPFVQEEARKTAFCSPLC